MRNTHETHQQLTTTEQQDPDNINKLHLDNGQDTTLHLSLFSLEYWISSFVGIFILGSTKISTIH